MMTEQRRFNKLINKLDNQQAQNSKHDILHTFMREPILWIFAINKVSRKPSSFQA
jgi:hypothetical protein